MKLTIIVSLLFLLIIPSAVFAGASTLQDVEEFLIDRDYANAVTVLQALLDEEPKDKAHLTFLMGNALFYQKQYENAIEWYEKLHTEYPESPWKQKALFKQAECYIQLKQFEQAEHIYEQEVIHLVSSERKEEIAKVYLDFAEEYFTGKWVQRQGQQGVEEKPDYGRAKTFYELALQMEISKEKKEEVQFQVARCAFELQNYAEAISLLTTLQKEYPDGKYLTQVVYYLGQSYLKNGQMLQARKVFRDFIEDYPDESNAPEAAFLLSRTYNIPNPSSAEELELGIKTLQDFLELYPEDKRVYQAEYEIGLSSYNFARYDDAIAAFTSYIQEFGEGSPEQMTEEDGDKTEESKYLPLARYYLGMVYQQQRKFQESIEVWNTFLQKHPSDKLWSDVQRQILDTEDLIADKLFREEDYEAARAAWERFLVEHPLDNRNPQMMYRIGETFVKRANLEKDVERSQALYQEALAQWKRTVSKYPNTEPASQAQYEIGHIMETRLSKFEEAFEAYKLVTWGSYASQAQARIREMQAKRLTVLTERAFRSDETPVLKVTTRNIKSLTFKMYTVDLETYFRKMQTTAGVDSLDIALIDPDKTWQETVEGYEKFREFEHQFPMQFSEPGAYLVTCSEETASGEVGYEATTLVLISDLDIIVKTTKHDALIFAQNMDTGKMYPEVKLLLSDGKKIFFEGTTKEDGVFHEAMKDLKDVQDLRVFAYDGTHYASNTLNINELQYVSGLESRGYIYTDRPAYRPGQQVNIRGILREVDEQGVLRVPKTEKKPEQEYSVQVVSSQGSPVYQENIILNDFGSFAVDFHLSSAAPTGEYRILVNRGKHSYSGMFLIEQYTLEKVKLSIETERDVYFRGETVQGTIKAEYYYGEPVKEKAVSYSLANVEVVSGVTDEHGEISFSLSTRDFAESQPITLTARLDDENVQTAKTVWLATRGFSCDVSTIRDVYLVNEDIEVGFTTKDPAGAPLKKNLSFGVFKLETTVYGEMAEVKIDEQQVSTAQDGTGKALIRIKEGGNYILRVEGKDRFGNPVSGQMRLFISGKDDDILLRIITDREEFKVGEQPEVTLYSRASEGLGLLTYEAESILSYQIISIHKENNPLPLAIKTEHAPNFTLSVVQMDGNAFHQTQKEFSVTQQLNISMAAQKPGLSETPEFFQPGETVEVHITTTDQNGRPVPAEVSLAMVDEALYTQYADMIPPIGAFFYDQRRGLLSKTDSSSTFSFSAETKEIVSAILEEDMRIEDDMKDKKEMFVDDLEIPAGGISFESQDVMNVLQPQSTMKSRALKAPPAPEPMEQPASGEFLTALRKYFPETGYWNPHIVTDDKGQAVITLKLPDSTTEWRFTSRGITKETLVGESTSGILTKLPFFVEMKVPSVFTEGDKASVLASVHNYSGSTQDVEMAFTGSMDETVIAQQEQQLPVEEQGVFETEYRLDFSKIYQLPAITPLSVELTATTAQHQDRMMREIPVRPWGIEYVTTKSGTFQDDRTVEISLPGDRHYLYREMSILLNPSLDRTLVDLTQDVPWLFKAPQSSSVHEATIVLHALHSLESFVADPLRQELEDRLKSLLVEIGLKQNQDGGWNWTGAEQRSDLFVSSDAVLLLVKAKQAGYILPPQVLENGITYLKRTFQSVEDNEIKAYMLYALTVAKDVDFAHVNRVYRERNSLHTTGLALLMLIYYELDRPEIATELLPLLQNRAQIQRDPTTGKQLAHWPSDSPYAWLQGDVDTTAFALFAVQNVAPASELVADAVEWLYTQRQWVGWGSAKTNSRVSFALLEHLSKTRYATNRYVLDVTVNGQPIKKIDVDAEQGAITLHIPENILKEYNNTISFDFEGRGSLNYVCVLKGTSRDVQKTQNQYDVRRYYEPAPLVFKGKEIPRGFRVLEGSYSSWRNTLTQVPLGGFGRVTLEFNRRNYDRHQPYKNHHLIVEEPIPAGCTVLEQSIQGQLLDYEIRDGKIVFYLNNANYGKISYDLYGYLPGEYKVLPTKIHSPYNPELFDYGEAYHITVLKRGQAVTEQYKKTPDELYYYGKVLFDEKLYSEARPLLQKLFEEFRLDPDPYRDTARMLMYIAIAEDNSRDIVQYFEVLKEKYPDLVLSFEDVVRVGKAYRDIQEYERAVQVFKATAEASFLKDIQISGILEAQGEFLPSVEYTKNLIMEYPDIPTTETSFYALAQLLYTEAERIWQNPGNYRHQSLSREELLGQTIAMLHQFLVRYPENPIVDEVSFSLANAYLDLEDFESVIPAVQQYQQRYPKSPYFSGYQYIEGYANFELEQYEESLELCRTVATGKYPDRQGKLVESDHKELAMYIVGQIYHSMGQPEQAIVEYEKVKDLFPDAKEAIDYFTRKQLKLDEVTTFTPGEETQIHLRYRNVEDVNFLTYRVDLMKLYLLQKNLNNITDINLAGITPYYQEALKLGEGKDYTDKTYDLALPLDKEGAYLVVAKEAELDTSGMVLLSQLKMEVEEDVVSGRIRVNVMNAETGRYENKVHVKVIGSHDTDFVSGSTDLRGIFIADNIHGTATVIARKGDQYAFYRGETALQPPDVTIQRPFLQAPADMRFQATQHLRETNIAIQQQSGDYLRQNLYQNKQTGVEVQSTY